MAPRIGAMGTLSRPSTRLPTGACCTVTCIQPPGAAQRSRTACAESRKENLEFSCSNFHDALERNDIIFNSKVCNEFQLYDIVVLRLGHWCKSKWPSSMYSANDFFRNPALVAVCWAKHQ
ncbi:hypothetical protein V6N13_017589 [Hibiscus sabdariffa]